MMTSQSCARTCESRAWRRTNDVTWAEHDVIATNAHIYLYSFMQQGSIKQWKMLLALRARITSLRIRQKRSKVNRKRTKRMQGVVFACCIYSSNSISATSLLRVDSETLDESRKLNRTFKKRDVKRVYLASSSTSTKCPHRRLSDL